MKKIFFLNFDTSHVFASVIKMIQFYGLLLSSQLLWWNEFDHKKICSVKTFSED